MQIYKKSLKIPYLRKRIAALSSPNDMKILIDNGHGIDTPGKRSPDGKLLEYAYTREIARRIVADLKDRGHDAELLVPEEEDIPLSDRVNRVNAICRAEDNENTILISIHVNAAGNDSKWTTATGWSCYTCKGQTESDRLATCLYVNGNQKCSDFGNIECSIFGIKTTVLLASAVQ